MPISPLFKKLNLKPGIPEVVILNSPQSFQEELDILEDIEVVTYEGNIKNVQFGLAFVLTLDDVNKATELLSSNSTGDVLLWMAYPKKSSKKYSCEFNRDTGWAALGVAGFEPVCQVAIDADWSALRFRRVEFIKSLKRSNQMAMSAEGKKRTSGNE